jgi:hypothetical protein
MRHDGATLAEAIVDSSGNGRNYNAYRPSLVPGVPGAISDGSTALSFNGVDDYASWLDHAWLDLPADFSIVCWVRPDRVTGTQHLVSRQFNGTLWGYILYLSGSDLVFYYSDPSGSSPTVTAAGVMVTGAWQRVTLIKDGATLKLRRNAVTVATLTATTSAPVATNTPLYVGAGHNGTALINPYDGGSDELAIFGRALTDAEDQAEYDAAYAVEALPAVRRKRLRLVWKLCDHLGVPMAEIGQRESAKVEVGLSEIDAAEVTTSIEEPAAQLVTPARSTLKVYIEGVGDPIFAGIVGSPVTKGAEGTITLAALSPGVRLVNSYISPVTPWQRFGLSQFQVDQGELMWRILISGDAYPTQAELNAGQPPFPISRGSIKPTARRDRQYEPGKNIWEALIELSEVIGGVDFRLRPVDRRDGILATLDVYEFLGRDLTNQVIFHFNCVDHNAVDLAYEPDGFALRNVVTAVGSTEEGREPPLYRSEATNSTALYGKWTQFTPHSSVVRQGTIEEHAREAASVQALPPQFFTVVPAIGGSTGEYGNPLHDGHYGNPPQPWHDYWLGDSIRARGRRGAMDVDLTGRITDIGLTEDSAGNVKPEKVECAPLLIAEVVT